MTMSVVTAQLTESQALVQTKGATEKAEKTAEEITEKFGLEAGLWNVFRKKDSSGRSKGDLAKDLLKRYGSAYLITSISFAIISFTLCYGLVNAGAACLIPWPADINLSDAGSCALWWQQKGVCFPGVDVAALLSRIGITVSDTNERVGTVAIAYAAHKALSPVRFPPTVALTPVVARLLGKDSGKDQNGSGNGTA